jgi:predicted enzyme related to lactoylglutathione lyase
LQSVFADRNEFSKVAFIRIAARAMRPLLALAKPPAIAWQVTVPPHRYYVFWRVEKYPIRIGSAMDQAQVEQKTYQMPPQDGFTVAHFLTVADIERSLRFYQTVFGSRILSKGDSKGAPGYLQIANAWLIVNTGGGPTPDKPSVTLSVPPDPNSFSSFMNIRVADIQACYEQWRNRGAEFITEPKDKYGETRCYIRDPDGYIIEVGQSKPDFTYG